MEVGVPVMLSISSFHIGLGDIVLPGIVVVYGIKKADELGSPAIGISCILGYAVGFLATLFIATRFRYPQPATIYLIPAVYAAMFGAAWIKKVRVC